VNNDTHTLKPYYLFNRGSHAAYWDATSRKHVWYWGLVGEEPNEKRFPTEQEMLAHAQTGFISKPMRGDA